VAGEHCCNMSKQPDMDTGPAISEKVTDAPVAFNGSEDPAGSNTGSSGASAPSIRDLQLPILCFHLSTF